MSPDSRDGAIIIGSDQARCDLVAPRRTVSGRHAEVRLGPDGTLRLVDLGSTNGTFVNGHRAPANEPIDVRLGDRIALGRSITFELGPEHVAVLYDPKRERRPTVLVDIEHTDITVVPTVPPDEIAAVVTVRSGSRDGSPTSSPDVDHTAPLNDLVASLHLGDDDAASPSDLASTLAIPPLVLEEPAPEGGGASSVDDAPKPRPTDPSIAIGYGSTNDVTIPNPVVSGRHARIYRLGDGRFVLEDQGSTNGTWIDGHRVTRALIEPGTTFSLGSHAVDFGPQLVALLTGGRAPVDRHPTVDMDPGRVLVVGRRSGCDIVIEAPTVSSRHARFTVLPDRRGYVLEDLDSTNGTFLNSRENRVVDAARATTHDVVFLGSYRLPVARLASLVDDGRALEKSARRSFVIGRDARAVDIALDSPVVSSRHAEVEVLDADRFRIRDLGSSNGTFLNGVAVRGSAIATTADRVSLGSYEVRLDAVHGVARREYHGDIMLQAERVSVEVPDPRAEHGRRRIIDDVSFTAYPTEFVGLMGPSGAGKTTLMMALGGILPPSRGRSLVNGLDVYESYNAFRGNIGYVPQDDIVFPQLTVYESLYYTARLRLPEDTTREEIDTKIEAILAELEILHTRDTIIGDALEKGISGGERKRVNLAQELITGPALLFLDEPTSGLASEDTINVMRMLRGLADTGKTILLTIHQPSLDAYRLMDTVLYLFRGNLVFYGPAYPDSILHFNREVAVGPAREKVLADPGNAMKPLVEEQRKALATGGDTAVSDVVARRRLAFEQSGYHREYVAERAREPEGVDVPHAGVQKAVRRGLARQWAILSARTARIKRKDRVNTAILMIQAPVIAAILWMVFAAGTSDYFESMRRGPAALFLLVASAVWFGCSNAAREIVGEQAIYRRERMVNLMIPAYALSKVTVLGVVCAIQCAVLLGIVYLPLHLEGSFLTLYAVLLATSLVGLGMGLTLSALVRSQQAAVALVPLMLIPQIILGGVIMPVHEMSAATRTLAGLTAARWGYEAALHAEFGDDDVASVRAECGIPECVWSTGATGFSYTYYPGDPDAATETETTAGVESLQGGQIPYVAPDDDPLCQAFCPAVKEGDEITPLDRSLGPDPADPVRMAAVTDIAVDGHAPDLLGTAPSTARRSFGFALSMLGAYFVFFVALVMALMRYRDVEVG